MGELRPGALVSGYRIERRLGSGATGTVYLAQHPRLPRQEALKVLAAIRGANPEFRARFIREAELAGRLDHPNIVSIYDYGTDGDTLWIAMRFVGGHDAAALLRQASRGLSPERAVGIVAAAASGLDEAHRAGLLHRDVKPANIMIEPGEGGRDRAMITDFGIARSVAALETDAVSAGSMTATLAYAAPEQIRGGPIDKRADVYGLGCTLYQLLTGTVPFPRDSAAAVMHAQLTAPPPRPSRINPELSPDMDAVIARALAKNPQDRYAGCGELAAAAGAALRGRPRSRVHKRSRRIALAAAAMAVVLTAAGGIGVAATRHGSATHGANVSDSPTAVAAPSWAAHQFMVDAFPGLLPATPSQRGYQGIVCNTTDQNGHVAALTDATPPVSVIECSGEGNPVIVVSVRCNTDRSVVPASDMRAPGDSEGSETWSRPSGTGRLAWRTERGDGQPPEGRIEIRFDGPARDFCKVGVWGASSGRELHDRWWPTAPL